MLMEIYFRMSHRSFARVKILCVGVRVVWVGVSARLSLALTLFCREPFMDPPDHDSSEASVVLTEAPAGEGLCLNRLAASVDALEYTTYDAFKRDCTEVSTPPLCHVICFLMFEAQLFKSFKSRSTPNSTEWDYIEQLQVRCLLLMLFCCFFLKCVFRRSSAKNESLLRGNYPSPRKRSLRTSRLSRVRQRRHRQRLCRPRQNARRKVRQHPLPQVSHRSQLRHRSHRR